MQPILSSNSIDNRVKLGSVLFSVCATLFVFIIAVPWEVAAQSSSQWLVPTGDSSPSDSGRANLGVVASTAITTITIASDSNTEFLSGTVWLPAVPAWVHPAWPSVPGAQWMWKSYQVTADEAFYGSAIITFRRRFKVPLISTNPSGTIQISADNAYAVYLNGTLIGSDGVLTTTGTDESYRTVETYQVNALPGDNELLIRNINYQYGSYDPTINPAGVVFRVDLKAQEGPLPFFDLPFAYSNFAAMLQSHVAGSDGRVNTWFDHQYPTYCFAPNVAGLRRFDGASFSDTDRCVDPIQWGRQGVSYYDGHNGIDFIPDPAAQHTTPVRAAYPGTVISTTANPFVTWCKDGPKKDRGCGGGYGNQVWINHGNGFATLYAHITATLVTSGTVITNLATQPLATMDDTGNSNGVHLHFGLYYTQSISGPWRPNDVVDPYGWRPCTPSASPDDPWNQPPYNHQSIYLWKESICPLKPLDATGAVLTSPTNKVKANIPPGAVASSLTVQLGDVPAVAEPSAQLKSVGRSFLLEILEWLTSTGNGPSSVNATPSFSEPVTLTVTYNVTATRHMDPNQLAVYRWNDVSSNWLPLSSTVDLSNTELSATTTDIGNFDVQGPLLCPTDVSEPDDSAEFAQPILTDGTALGRLFDIADDEDRVHFDAVAGQKYVIQTRSLAAGVDTVLELYDTSGIDLLASNDNFNGGPASRIDWVAPTDGTYFVRVTRAPGGTYGCGSTYQLSVTAINHIYLPLIQKN